MYFTVRNDGEEMGVYESDQKLEKETLVVIPFCGSFITAYVFEPVDELTVLTKYRNVESIITVVDLTNYNVHRESVIKKAKLKKAMEDKMDDIKMEETLRKFATKDYEFGKLFQEFEELMSCKKTSNELNS